MTKQERLAIIRNHPKKTLAQLAELLGISVRTVQRDRAELSPEIPDSDTVSTDPVQNLRTQQQHLRESLKVLSLGSETYRKTLGNISELELHIAKLLKPSDSQVEYEYVCLMDSGGVASCVSLDKAPKEVRNRMNVKKWEREQNGCLNG